MRELDARARCIFEVGEHYAREFWSDSSELQRSWAPLSCSGHLITGMATSNNALQCIRQSWWKSTFDTSTNLSNSSCCSSAAARHKKLDPHNTWPGVGRRDGPDIVNIFWKLWLTLSFTICIYVLGVVPEHLTLGKGNAKNGHTAWVPTERSTMPNRPEGPKPNLGSN